jgi:tight adherence protein B
VVAAIAGELAAGSPPGTAVLRVGAEHRTLLAHAGAAARCGGDIAAALDRDGCGGAPILRDAAVAWRVGAATGTGLCAALRTLVRAARDAEDVRTALEGQLAAPRATARTMAFLPIIGLGLGALLGADPFDWLLGSAPGLLCLVAAVALTLLGVGWMNRIANRVEAAL